VSPHPQAGSRLRLGLRLGLLAAALAAATGVVLVGWGLAIKAKAGLAQILLDRAFTASLASGEIVKAWPWADTFPVARIEVDRLGASAVVLSGTSGEALAFGPGHLDTSRPLGRPGTAIVAAHRDTHFRFLGELVPGDVVRVTTTRGERLSYKVTGARIVRFDASGLDPLAPGERLALVTCWPLDARERGPLRYVLEAERLASDRPTVTAAR
jgi:sortase A